MYLTFPKLQLLVLYRVSCDERNTEDISRTTPEEVFDPKMRLRR